MAEDFFQKEGFQPVVYKGVPVWKKGNGLLTAPQYVQIAYGGGVVHIEAFLRTAIFPGVYVGEMGLDGAYGFLMKEMLRGKLNQLIALLCQPLPGQPAPAPPPPPETVPVGAAAGTAAAAYGTGMPAPAYPGAYPPPRPSRPPSTIRKTRRRWGLPLAF